MTLPTWVNLVKLPPEWAKHIWLGGALLLLLLLALLRFAQNPMAQAEAYAALVAESIAELSVGPLVRQDRIELGLLSNRMARLSAVTGVSVMGMDQQVLAISTPDPRGITRSHPIQLDDAVIGYVRVTVDPGAVSATPRWPWLLTLLALLLMPWLLAILQWLLQTLQDRQTTPTGTGLQLPDTAPAPDSAEAHVLVVSLLNQLGMNLPQQQMLLEFTKTIASEVAALYRGRIEALPGKGLAIWFANGPSVDRPFEVVCAGLLLARYLNARSEEGKFQLGLHYREGSDRNLILADATLLAAAAGEGQVILSDQVMAGCSRKERLITDRFEHPLGQDFATADAHCYRLTDLAQSYALLLDRQLQSLLTQVDSTDSESTF